ncbi:MAG: DNA repair exonuclease [Tissierellia bacterium]|nr:DNA repair exonuclease [Tissierellia bacterium]
MIRFIHTGDIHLGLKFNNVSFDREKAIARRREIWNTFERIIQYAKEKEVDFLFIAGDLFEEAYFTIGDITRVRDNFKSIENVNIIISAGNHDYRGRKSLYDRIQWSSNVTIFGGQAIGKKDFPDLNTVVYGYSWETKEIYDKELFKNFIDIDNTKNNILVLHGDISHNSNYLPLSLQELKDLNMDYIALGHIHKPQILADNIAYCGCPEPLDFGEEGERGIIEGTIINKRVDIKFLPFSRRKFIVTEIEVNENMNYLEIVERIKNIPEGNRDKDFYRITLKGYISRSIDMANIIKDLEESFYHIELIDKTIWDYDLESLEEENKDNIIYHYIRTMKEKGLDDPVVKRALYLGLEVLLKGRE